MSLDKKSLSFLDQLQSAYALDESDVQHLNQHLPIWSRQCKEMFQELFELVKKEKVNSKSLKSSLLDLSVDLHTRLSDKLTEHDLLKILTEAFFLSYILKDTEWQAVIKKAHLSSLAVIIEKPLAKTDNKHITNSIQKISNEISTFLSDDTQKQIWLYLVRDQQHTAIPTLLSQKAAVQLIANANDILKRKLGLSLNDADTKILWLNTIENHWELSLMSCIDPDWQEQTLAERMVSCKLDFADFVLHAQAKNHPFYWQDPLNEMRQGLQTNLFSSNTQKNTLATKLEHSTFSFIVLDIRQSLHPYRYARRTMPVIDQQIANTYQNLGVQPSYFGQLERIIYRAWEKLDKQGMIMAILPASFLEDPESQSLRLFLELSFQKIYVLDLHHDNDEGLAILYLVKKPVEKQKQDSKIQYTKRSFAELMTENGISFESLVWSNVNADQQNYWIGMPESDFFSLYPIFGTEQAIFKSKSRGLESFMDEWLMDDDPKHLEKKVKHLFKQYAKGIKKEEGPSAEIKWTEVLKKMANEGISLSFDKSKIKKILRKPFVYTYLYAEEKFLSYTDDVVPAIAYDFSLHQVYALNLHWHASFFDQTYAFPLKNKGNDNKTEDNISDAALKEFQDYYKLRTKAFDHTFIVFPPENITNTLNKIELVSRDLPVIRKYPNQINHLLEEARHFTSDVELLTPPYEKIDEFKHKVLRLEKDAIERKVIYQRVKSYIEELKEQLSSLTHEHDEAQKDYEAVNKENIFFYVYAVLHDPRYKQKYHSFLKREFPRIPMYPSFRKWVQWGEALFHAHQLNTDSGHISEKLQMKEEKREKQQAKSFAYKLEEERGIIEMNENYTSLIFSNIPKEACDYKFEGKSPFAHYLDYLSKRKTKDKKSKVQFTQNILAEKMPIFENLKQLCNVSIRLKAVMKEMQKRIPDE